MSTERSIPHLRDVFGLGAYRTPYHHQPNANSAYPVPAHHQPYQPADTFAPNRQITPQQHQQARPQLHNKQQSPSEHPTTITPSTTSATGAKPASRKNRDNYKTLTSGDVKTLERHLSMKKTIRKKIMRDLQQAFVDDPAEFKADHHNADHMRSELNMEAFRFGDSGAANNSDNFLVMLRDDQQQQQHYHHHRPTANDSPQFANKYTGGDAGSAMSSSSANYYDYELADVARSDGVGGAAKSREDKPSFWKRFTFKKKTST